MLTVHRRGVSRSDPVGGRRAAGGGAGQSPARWAFDGSYEENGQKL